ncbi:hypothetical protein SBRCBS47491_003979 [Sporothrix bragantina]|uniref:GH18 domain-containing protein n=1 Tax=Sporothrix bragantina TaxID=671064 RepID=A0ABP0BJL4_9PEZI
MASLIHLIVACMALIACHGTRAWPVKDTPSIQNNRRDVSIAAASYTLPRLVIYFQTTHDSATGQPISMLPLITEQGIALTHLIVCSFHIGQPGSATTPTLHLNDYPPSDPRFATLWNETAVLQAAGVRVMGMVGGAAPGSFATNTLDSTNTTEYEAAYAQLYDAIVAYNLQGMDLDVEQSMSQAGITRLVERLNGDFGPNFEVTMAPVASALKPGGSGANLSGFNYATLATTLATTSGAGVSFYNAQFYNGFGSLATTSDYEAIVSPPDWLWTTEEVLLGQITAPSEGSGYTAPGTLNATVVALRDYYGTGHPLGGIMGWEYFDSAPGSTSAPWQWAQDMTAILRPGLTPTLSVTRQNAEQLQVAYKASVVKSGSHVDANVAPSVDYMALVNV